MMNDPSVGIIYRRDWHPGADRFADLLQEEILSKVLCDEHVPLSEALTRRWQQDAHVALYSLRDEDDDAIFARANKRCPLVAELLQKKGRVDVPILIFDYDLPKIDGIKQTWSEEGLGEFVQGLAEADLPSPTYWYTTLHGCRWVYVLTKSVDHLRAEGMANAMFDQFAKAGIRVDESCKDWTRLFRLPYTVREDTGKSYDCLFVNGGPGLDPDSIKAADVSMDVFAEVTPYSADMPDHEEVQHQLQAKGDNGRLYPSDWSKTARKFLVGREAFSVCFEDAPIDVSQGWNNGIVKLVGQIVGMTARQETASPEGIFAILFSALEQIQVEEERGANQTEWFSKAWDIICRMWANEQAQIEAENAEREKSLIQAKAVREDLIKQMRIDRPEDVPKDETTAEEFLKKRMIASDGMRHWIMRPDSSYNLNPVGDSMLIPMIRELGMEDVIEINEMRGKSWVTKGSKAILDEHATPITNVRCSSREKAAYIEGEAGYRSLHLPVHRLNRLVVPTFSADVDSWLRVLFADKYDLGIDWLSWALEVNAPICAINFYGAPGAGKGLLVQGLAECFEGERMNDGRALGKFNEGLLHTPVINCDEGVPSIKSDEALALDQAFRSFVSGGNITIRSMYQNPFTANIYPRIVFTSNDRDILRSIVGHRDLTDDDVRAIELRLLSIQVTHAAREHLTAKGNYAFTAGWVHGKRRSNYILAGHIHYLYQHRKPSKTSSGRLLVEGEVDTTLVRGMRLRSTGAQSVLRALAQMIESPSASRDGIHVDPDGNVWVTPSGIVKYTESATSATREPLSLPRAGQVLRQFSGIGEGQEIERVRPVGAERGRWIKVDLGVLFEETERYGINNARIEKLLRAQPDGHNKAAAAQAHLDPHGHD